MKYAVCAILIICAVLPLAAFEAGGGISVFIPETLYKYGEGTIAFEKTVSTSLGFGKIISLPIGINYHHADGYVIESDALQDIEGPMLYGDTFSGYVMLQAKIPISPVYFKIFGGGTANWAFVLRPYAGYFDKALAVNGGDVAIDSYGFEPSLGVGWIAGGAVGVSIGQISVDLGVSYRDIRHNLAFDASGYEVNSSTGTVTNAISVDESEAVLALRGISVSLAGSFAF